MKRMIATALVGATIALTGIGAAHANAETNVQSSNSCEDCKTETGDASSANSSSAQVGHNSTFGDNVQEGDNELEQDQSAHADSGDGVPGTVIGVASSDGDVNVVSSNSCVDCKTSTGNASAANAAVAFVGLTSLFGNNVQTGDNSAEMDQASFSSTGDGITGTVIGVVSA